MMADERHEDFTEAISRCAECGASCGPDEWERVKGRALCRPCVVVEKELVEQVSSSTIRRYREMVA
jgi:recombinational DNA repair protein (RecF pathway)